MVNRSHLALQDDASPVNNQPFKDPPCVAVKLRNVSDQTRVAFNRPQVVLGLL